MQGAGSGEPMSTAVAQVSIWRSLPFAQLRKNRYFYMYYDAAYALGAAVAIGAMVALGHYGLYGEGNLLGAFQWWHLAFFPLITYCIILCHVFAHVCTHQSLPKPWNRIVGELCGLVVLTRFASWEVVHQRHHRYSDNTEKDPHPCLPSYLRHFWLTISNVERQLQQTFFDLYGDTPENHAYEKRRAYVSYATNILVISAFFLFLGPIAFFVFFAPASILAAFHLVHFNWSTHNAQSPTADYHPVNLNHGYFKLGNKLFFGIYMHANHHKWPNVLNPAYAKVQLPIEPAPTAETEAARAVLKKTWGYSARPAAAE
jgi:fatty acid desaturase